MSVVLIANKAVISIQHLSFAVLGEKKIRKDKNGVNMLAKC